MGTWGTKSYENDSAIDWLDEFQSNPTISFLRDTINMVITEEYIESDEAMQSLAAIEVVAELVRKSNNTFLELDATTISSLSDEIDETLKTACHTAIHRIISPQNNELYDLWRETNSFQEWKNNIENLYKRIS